MDIYDGDSGTGEGSLFFLGAGRSEKRFTASRSFFFNECNTRTICCIVNHGRQWRRQPKGWYRIKIKTELITAIISVISNNNNNEIRIRELYCACCVFKRFKAQDGIKENGPFNN
jgi:hypothetical protein